MSASFLAAVAARARDTPKAVEGLFHAGDLMCDAMQTVVAAGEGGLMLDIVRHEEDVRLAMALADQKPLFEELAGPVPDDVDESPVTTGLRLEVDSDQVIDKTPQTDELYAMTVRSFEDERLQLPKMLLRGLYEMKFVRPSKMQAASLPKIWAGRDLLVRSGNGTGKTTCFALGMLKKVNCRLKAPQALCICPTRELAKQVGDEICKMSKYMITEAGMKIKVILRDERWEKGQQIEEQIVVGTPGKVKSLIRMRVLRVDMMQVFVLDEADEMNALGRPVGDETRRIRKQLPKKVQCLVFSATWTEPVIELAAELAKISGNDWSQIEVKREHIFSDQVTHLYYRTNGVKDKEEKLCKILNAVAMQHAGVIIYVNSRGAVDVLAKVLTASGFTVSAVHGRMEALGIDKALADFRAQKSKFLITTNVLTRGIDVPGPTLVIQFDMPVTRTQQYDPETYLSRGSPTGHFSKPRTYLSLIHDDRELKILKQIETYFSREGLVKEVPPVTPPEDFAALLKVSSDEGHDIPGKLLHYGSVRHAH